MPSHFIGIFSLGPCILIYFFRCLTPPWQQTRVILCTCYMSLHELAISSFQVCVPACWQRSIFAVVLPSPGGMSLSGFSDRSNPKYPKITWKVWAHNFHMFVHVCACGHAAEDAGRLGSFTNCCLGDLWKWQPGNSQPKKWRKCPVTWMHGCQGTPGEKEFTVMVCVRLNNVFLGQDVPFAWAELGFLLGMWPKNQAMFKCPLTSVLKRRVTV